MDSNYDDNDLEFGAVPSFIPKDAPALNPANADPRLAYNAAIERFVGKGMGSAEKGKALLDELLARMEKEWDSEPVSREYGEIMSQALNHGFIEFQEAQVMMGALVQEYRTSLEQGHHNDIAAPVASGNQATKQASEPGETPVTPMVEKVTGADPAAAAAPLNDDTSAHALLMSAAQDVVAQAKKSPSSRDKIPDHDEDVRKDAGVHGPEVMVGAVGNQASTMTTARPFVNTVSEGQESARSGLHTLADGGLGVIGGLSSLVGVVGRGVGRAARGLAEDLSARAKDATGVAPSVSVLPKISEYRVGQAEKMAKAYESAMGEFWQSGRLPDVRRAIEEHARTSGVSVPDVMAKMVPGGELEGLRTSFMEAVNESPKAQDHKVAMGKALDGWIRQYERGSEEVLNPDSDASPEHKELRGRFEKTKEKMADLVSENPIFAGDELSHAEKFKQAIERITQKVQEMMRAIVDLLHGNTPKQEAQQERDYEP